MTYPESKVRGKFILGSERKKIDHFRHSQEKKSHSRPNRPNQYDNYSGIVARQANLK